VTFRNADSSARSSSSSAETPALSRLQIQQALRLSIWEGCSATVHGSLTSGAFQTGFALFLGCSSFWLGALGGIPALAGLVQLLSSFLAQRYGERKTLMAWFSLASRLLWVPMLLIPFLLPSSLWVAAFLLLTLLSSLCMNVSAPLWTAWITDIVPEGSRGRYFGQRNMYAGWVGLAVPILGGYFLDSATKRHSGSEPAAFGILFLVATLFALSSFGLILKSPDIVQVKPGTNGEERESALSYYKAPFADRNFQRVMAFLAVMVIGQSVAGQFFTVYQLQYLQLNYTAFQLLTAVSTLASLASMPLWGYLADKYGNKPMLVISCALVLVPPLLWILAAPDGISGLWAYDNAGGLRVSVTKLVVVVLNLFSGVGWAGVGLTQFNLMIGASPPEKRTVYVSAIAAISGLAGGLAPLAGGALMVAFGHLSFPTHGYIQNPYHLLFLIATLARVGAMALIGPIKEDGSRQTGYVLKQLKASKPIGSFTGIQTLSKSGSSSARVLAAERLGRLKTPLAVEELVRALDDVALPVREQAAQALGEIGDPRATLPLVGKLSDASSGISGPAATALGKIGDSSALPALAAAAQLGPPPRRLAAMKALGYMADGSVTEILCALLGDPDHTIRTAAIRALAEREDPASLASLMTQIECEEEPSNLAVLADALGRLGDPAAAPALLAALSRTQSPTVRREILNAVGSLGGGRDAFYSYLALDSYARDETVGKILLNLSRRYRARASQKKGPEAARIAVYSKHALAAYTSGDNTYCVSRLVRLGSLLPSANTGSPASAILAALGEQAAPPETEEVLLAVFLVRRLTEG